MSRKKNHPSDVKVKSTLESISCIVKFFGNMSKMLYAESEDENTVIVKPVPGKYDRPLCLSRGIVYAYDPDLLSKLELAYRSGKTTELGKIWRDAPRYP